MRDPLDDIYEAVLFGIDRRTLYTGGTVSCVKDMVEYYNQRYGTAFRFIGEDGISKLYILCDPSADQTNRAIFLGVLKKEVPAGVTVNLVEVVK